MVRSSVVFIGATFRGVWKSSLAIIVRRAYYDLIISLPVNVISYEAATES